MSPFKIEWYKTVLKGVGFTKKQGILRSSIILMVSVLVGKAAGLVFKIFLANMLGGTGMGYFSSAYAVFTPLYALCAASLTPAVAQLVSENEGKRLYSRVRGVKTAALKIFVLPSVLCSVVPMAFAGFITKRFIGNEGAAPAVAAILPCVFLGTVTAIYRGYYEGLRNMTPTALSQITESAVRVGAGLGFAYFLQARVYADFLDGKDIFGVHCASQSQLSDVSLPYIAAAAILGVTASEISSFLFMLIRHRFGSDGIAKNIRPEKSEVKEEGAKLLKLIVPISTAAIVSSLAGTVDLYTIIFGIKTSLAKDPLLYSQKYADIIASGVSLKELPNYLYGSFTGLAATVFGLAPSLCSVFGKSALPNIAEAWAKGDGEKVGREIKRVLTVIMYISVPAGFGLCAFSREILGLLFSSRVEEAAISARPLSIMALGTAFVTLTGAAYSMLQAVGKAELPIKINLLGAFVRLGLDLVLVPMPSLGLSGAAIASLASGAVMCFFAAGSLLKITSTKPSFALSAAAPIVGGAISVGIALKFRNTFANCFSNTVLVGISVNFAVISYIIFVVLLDISTKNRLRKEILGK